MKENRVRFARVRTPQDNEVRLLDLPVRTGAPSGPKNRRQPGDAWSVSGTVTTVDIVTAHDHTGKLLGQKIGLITRF